MLAASHGIPRLLLGAQGSSVGFAKAAKFACLIGFPLARPWLSTRSAPRPFVRPFDTFRFNFKQNRWATLAEWRQLAT